MFALVDLPPVKFINMYTKPINMRLGEDKIIDICLQEMKIDPKDGDVFLFFNKDMDRLKLFFIDYTGTQIITKALPKGGFMLPVPKDNAVVVKIDKSKLGATFKS